MRRLLSILLLLLPAVAVEAGAKQVKFYDHVWRLIRDGYYDPKFNGVDWAAVRARYLADAQNASNDREIYLVADRMAAELKDAHTRVMNPRESSEERDRSRLAFGFSLRMIDGQYIVMQVEPKSAMDMAGVSRGWVLRRINDQVAPQEDQNALADWLGKAGIRDKCMSHLTVEFGFVDGQDHTHEVAANCAIVNTTPRHEMRRLAGGVLYVRFDAFNFGTGAWFAQTLDANRDATGLIVDLRWNPGGLKSQLLRCLDELYAKPISAGTDFTRSGRHHDWKIQGRGADAFTKPMVVLVDERSASSSEIMASAIQESGRGWVVGRKTSGKVLLSYEIPLAGGGRLQLAFRDYRTERGRRLESAGVVPDETVPMRAADLRSGVDRDVERALAILNHQ